MSGIRVTIAKGHQGGGQQTPDQGVAPKHLQFSQLTNYLTADCQRDRDGERKWGKKHQKQCLCWVGFRFGSVLWTVVRKCWNIEYVFRWKLFNIFLCGTRTYILSDIRTYNWHKGYQTHLYAEQEYIIMNIAFHFPCLLQLCHFFPIFHVTCPHCAWVYPDLSVLLAVCLWVCLSLCLTR